MSHHTPKTSRHSVLAAGAAGMLVFAVSTQLLPTQLGLVSRAFQQNLAQRGLLLGIAPLGFFVAALLSGYLSDRWGQRPFIWLGLSLLSLGLLLAASAADYPALQAALLVIGVSGGFLESPISAVVANTFHNSRAQMLNILQMFFNLGAVGGPLLVGVLLATGHDWRAAFAAGAGLALAALLLAVSALPPLHAPSRRRPLHLPPRPIPWRLVSVVALAQFLYVGGEMTFATWAPNYLEETFGTSPKWAAQVLTGFWLGMMLGRGVYVFLVKRMGHLIPILLSSVLAVGAGLAIVCVSSPLAAATFCCLAGFFFAGTWPTLLGYAAHKAPERTGTVFGVIVAMGAAGAVVFPPLAGWMAHHTGRGLPLVMVVGAAAIALEAIVVLGLWLREMALGNPRP